MIKTKEVKIKTGNEFSSEYIENELNKTGYDILSWAVTSCDKDNYIINLAIVE